MSKAKMINKRFEFNEKILIVMSYWNQRRIIKLSESILMSTKHDVLCCLVQN